MSFVNLHNHFDYSILDGGMKVDKGVQRAVELGQPAIAITDHGTMGGVYELYKRSAERIRPIIGIEAYCAPSDRTHKSPVFWGPPDARRDDISGAGKYTHLTLLARNAEGVRNLFRLQHDGYAQGFYGKPRIDLASLGSHSEGLICLTGCPSGHIQTRLRLGQHAEALDHMAALHDIFGRDHLYVELMDHGLDIERRVRDDLLELAKHFNLPLVATGDAHYATPDQKDTHAALLCIQTKSTVANPKFTFDGDYHLPSYEEISHVFSDLPDAISNTLRIADMCSGGYGDIFEPKVRLPKYSENEELDLERLVLDGCPDTLEHQTRAQYELEVICSQGYAGYFLTLMEVMNEGRSAGTRFGPGRGSAGGSFVAYRLGITQVDPIEHGLLFERFLNPERISLPDIDTDIDDSRRDDFIRLVIAKFGEGYVAHAGAYNIIKSRASLKDAARVLGHPYTVGERLVSQLPPNKFGREPTLAELPSTAEPEEIVGAARGMEGIIRGSSVHASAVVISPDYLPSLVPLKIPASGAAKGKLATEFTGAELEELGYVKYDFLGLTNLGVIDECLHLLRSESLGVPVTLPDSYDDPATFELLSSGQTSGVFQMDGFGMRQLLRRVRPDSLGDVAAVLALYRPGPMGANSHNEYAERKHGRSAPKYPHPEYESTLADVLSSTYGLIVFQEQVLRILAAVGGYTYATAGLIFDAMRKKDTAKMLAAKPDFVERLTKNGYSHGAIEALWETLVPFSDYSFNLSHATGYGIVSYWTAYLKAHYPREFYCALLSRETDADDVRAYIQSAVSDGVPVLPPDINESDYGWRVTEDGILFGLGSVKGISKATFAHIVEGRPYLSMEQWWERAHSKCLNLSFLSATVRSGAFDRLEPNREQLYANIDGLAARALADREMAASGQRRLWTGYSVLPGKPMLGLRQTWEQELLGTPLTVRAVRLKLRRGLSAEEWHFIKSTLDAHQGNQPVDIQIGPLTTLRNVGSISLTEKAVRSLEALKVIDVQEDE